MQIHDLSAFQRQVLEAMQGGQQVTRAMLKEQLNITVRSTLARILSRLEVFGLIEKQEEICGFKITSEGLRLLSQKSPVVEVIQGLESETAEVVETEVVAELIEVESHEVDECIQCSESVLEVTIPDMEWLRDLSLGMARRVINESDLNRIGVYSRAAVDLANVYSMLSYSPSVLMVSE